MKKLFFTLLTLCLCGATYAADFVESGIYYNILTTTDGSNQVEVTYTTNGTPSLYANENGYTGAITIPASVTNSDTGETYSVTSIGEYAFASSTATSVTIPGSVTTIGNYAFRGVSGLQNVTSPLVSVTFESEGLTSIGEYAFWYCVVLNGITLPSTLTSIGQYAFHNCTALTEITIPEGITSIEARVFDSCTALTQVSLPSTLTSIGDDAFHSCSALTEITIPAGVKSYGQAAFWNCPILTTVILLDTDPTNPAVEFGGTAGSGATGSTDVFFGDSGITFYVPRGSAAKYVESVWETEAETDSDYFNFFSIDINKMYTDGSDYYATYYMDEENYEVEVPSNSTIYAVTSVSDGVATMEALEGDIIPNGTPLLIKASDSSESESVTYYFWKDYYDAEGNPYFSESPSTISVPTSNMLYGHSEAGPVSEPSGNYLYYKLSLNASGDANSIGFYYGADGGAAYTAGAHRCWLAVPSSSDSDENPSGISFKKDDGDTTGISSVESASEKAVSGIYTIQGVRVSNMNQPGLYIVDGKKVLVK